MKPYSRLIMLPCILAFAAVMAIPGMVYGEARVLSYELDEEQTWTCDLVVDSSWEIDELSASGTHKLEAELTYTVTEDNLDNSYDIDIDQDNGQITVDDVGPDGISTGSDSIVQEDGRGKIVSQFDHELLFPDDEFDDFYFGALAEDEGMFVTTAVDVTDTWTQDLTVTPYGESSQPVEVSCELIEWTTLDGHNVGKVRRTYTLPVHAVCKTDSNITMDGDLSVIEYVWFDYSNHLLVKIERTTSGTLTLTSSNNPPDDEYDMDSSTTTTLVLQ